MAKKKAVKKMSNTTPLRRSMALSLKGSEEWKAWLERAADHFRIPISALTDVALAEYARNHGFSEEPPKR